MTKTRYTLINPHLKGGDFTTDESTPMSAAEDLWQKLAEFIKHSTPSFYFSIKDEKDGKISHFKVEESVVGGDVNSIITEHKKNKNKNSKNNAEIDAENDKKLLKNYEQDGGKINGGKRRIFDDDFDSDSSSDSSSNSSSDSSSSDVMYAKGSMGYNTYLTPYGMPYKTNEISLQSLIYYPNVYDVNDITIPSFMSSFTPYVNIKMLPLATVNIPLVVVP